MLTPRLLALAPLVTATLLLGGCSLPLAEPEAGASERSGDPSVDSASAPADLPYPNPDDAVYDAHAVVADYLRVHDMIRQDGGRGIDRLRPFVSDEVYSAAVLGSERWQREGLSQRGDRELRSSVLGSVAQSDGVVAIETHHCISGIHAEVVTGQGDVVVDVDNPPALVITAVVTIDRDGRSSVYSIKELDRADRCKDLEQ